MKNIGLSLIGLLVGLLIAEAVLRFLPKPVTASESMTPGLIQYDARLGWRLTPGWQGKHSHEEFTVEYAVDPTGVRLSPAARTDQRWRKRTLWLGDSMSFGLGAANEETFINRLNEIDANGVHLNRAVPGYSTDQQILLLEALLRRERPERVVMVTYIANDILDNGLDFPMQAERRKPRFVVENGELSLTGVPIKVEKRPATHPRNLGQALLQENERQALLGYGSALLQRLFSLVPQLVVDQSVLEHRLDEPIRLYEKLIQRFRAGCEAEGLDCRVLLLSGRSVRAAPNGLSGTIQSILLEKLGGLSGVDAIDLPSDHAGLYYPKDGHLTADGHQAVADWIIDHLGIKTP